MIFTTNHVGNTHGDIVDYIDQMKDWVTILAHNHEIHLLCALDPTTHRVINHHWRSFDFFHLCFAKVIILCGALALELEPNRTVFLISTAGILQL